MFKISDQSVDSKYRKKFAETYLEGFSFAREISMYEQDLRISFISASNLSIFLPSTYPLPRLRTFFTDLADQQKYMFLKSTCRDLSIPGVFAQIARD